MHIVFPGLLIEPSNFSSCVEPGLSLATSMDVCTASTQSNHTLKCVNRGWVPIHVYKYIRIRVVTVSIIIYYLLVEEDGCYGSIRPGGGRARQHTDTPISLGIDS